MQFERRDWWALINSLLIILLFVIVLRCYSKTECPDCPTNGTSIVELIEQSPCDSVPFDAVVMPPRAAVALTGGDTFENEVHDCQRLIVPKANPGGDSAYVFGPLIGVFPLDTAMKLLQAQDFADGRPVATFYNWGGFGYRTDPLEYEPLGIPDDWSCLWLRYVAPQGTQPAAWEAAVVPVDTMGCALATDTPSVWNLHAGRLRFQEVSPGDSAWALPSDGGVPDTEPASGPFPATARWGWDERAKQHYVGVKCGQAWCVIGAPGFAPRLPDQGYAGLVPGWYDEEHLAVPGPDGRVIPGPWARYYPTGALFESRILSGEDLMALFTVEGGLEVAEIYVDVHSARLPYDADARKAYIAKKGLVLDESNHGYVALRIEIEGNDTTVHAEYRRTSGSPGTATPATRYGNASHAASGAVRFRWLDTDQKQWEPCGDDACCDTGA